MADIPMAQFMIILCSSQPRIEPMTLENGPEADETNSTPETEEMSDNRSPDLSFENEADGLLVESSASLLDVSLRLHDYGRFTPVPAIIRHQCEQVQPELISVVTQTDDTRVPRSISTQTSTETSTVGIQVDRPSFTFEDIRDDDDKVLFYTGIPTAGTFECLFDEIIIAQIQKEGEIMGVKDPYYIPLLFMRLLKHKSNKKHLSEMKQEHRLAGADRSSIFFLKVKGLSFSITKEGGVE
ncbi:hypothetical protein DPMN_032136 [Dreissena polymorpha]|uniref:Uncharacterized protein n=1 Tax=Dreissena polymorpha TaxID=45954 RepID=A0A9D4RHP5_DREPO|nr:hypothetical protein DPMN_032136 [Dreissena polymorpha]